MMNIIQATVSGFTRSASRRMDAELCIINLAQPELDTDIDALLARVTRLEDQVRSGSIVVSAPAECIEIQKEESVFNENVQSVDSGDAVSLPETVNTEIIDQTPVGFWTDVAAAVRKELNPALAGFFITTPNAPLKGVLSGDKLLLVCNNQFVMEIVNVPDIVALVARKASAKLGRQVRVVVTDNQETVAKNEHMDQLLSFGREHPDVVRIKE